MHNGHTYLQHCTIARFNSCTKKCNNMSEKGKEKLAGMSLDLMESGF